MIGIAGWVFIIAGVISCFTIAAQLKVVPSDSTYADPHPLRWVYGLYALFTAPFFGFVLIDIADIIESLKENREQNDELIKLKKREITNVVV